MAVLALASCQKSGLNAFRGSYSFKSSGEVTVQRPASIFDTVPPAAYTINLPNEIGQLEISALDQKNDSVVVVLNYYDGNVVATHGRCQDREIVLKEFSYNNLKLTIDGNLNVESPVRVSAIGHIYDGNTIILNLSYRGYAMVGLLRYNISGDNIMLVANRNY